MFENIIDPDFQKNVERTGADKPGFDPCCLCGRAVAKNNARAFDTKDGKVVGADCAAKHPELHPHLIKRDVFKLMALH